jgi:hypothetical protein
MGYVIIKQAPDRDEYVIWCTSSERFAAAGDCAEIARDAAELEPERDDLDARLDHVDLRGSSMIPYSEGWWEQESLIYEQRGYLPRRHLYYAALLQLDGRHAEVWDLLEPFEDEREVRRG